MKPNPRMRVGLWAIAIPLLASFSCQLTSGVSSPTTTPHVGQTPAPATTAHLAEATASPLPASAADGLGLAGFRDQFAVADQFFVTLADVSPPPAGQAYQGWLLSDDGTVLSVGMLTLASDGAATLVWNSPNSENLLGRYARFQITLEPEAGSANPTGKAVFAGGLEGEALTNARRLFVKNDGEPTTPLNTPYALGLLAQTDIAHQHIQNASNAAAIGAHAEMRAHLEHIINILEGMNGPRYSDHDGNGTAENPGDGFGVIGYSAEIAVLLAGQAPAAEAAAAIQAHSLAIQDKCLEIITLTDSTAVTAELAEAEQLINQLQVDLVAQLYQAAQASAQFEVSPVE